MNYECDAYRVILHIPVNDDNYKSGLERATDEELKQAIDYFKENPKGNKGRLLACKRELRKRNRGELV